VQFSTLELLAELSIAILGFAGLTAVFGHSKFDASSVTVRIRGLILSAGLAFAASVIPLIGVSLILSAAILLVATFATWYWMLKAINEGKFIHNPWITWPTSLIGIGCAIWLCYALMSNSEILSAYVAFTGYQLLLATAFYIRLVLSMEKVTKRDDT
jgi:hypothetical protein